MSTPSFSFTIADRVGRLIVLIVVAVAASVTCTDPTEPHGPSAVASIQLGGPPSMLVHESSLLSVTARDAKGFAVTPTPPVSFASSDPTIATVSREGVVHGVRRGTVTVSAKHDAIASHVTIRVKARVILMTEYGVAADLGSPLAIGESVRFLAEFADADGVVIGGDPTATWNSSDATGVTVDRTGLVTALRAGQQALITASTPDGEATTNVYVSDVVAGLPATVRFAHVAQGLGAITVRSNKLPPVTLEYGQSVDLPLPSGTFFAEISGLRISRLGRSTFAGMVVPGAALSLYVVGGPDTGFLTALWAPTDAIPADSGLVTLLQGNESGAFPVVYLRRSGEPRSGLPELCYFDPGDPSPTYRRTAGAFDLILQGKGGYSDSATPFVRLPANIPAGHAVTLVLEGSSLKTASYLSFTDR